MDRSPKTGFRCALCPNPEKIPPAAFEATTPPGATRTAARDYYREPPVADSIFQVYRDQFSYDKTDLKAEVEERKGHPGGWIQEKITFDAAYGGERVTAYLFLPERTVPPYQTVIYFPGAAAAGGKKSSDDLESYYEFTVFLKFLVTNGRAVLFPVYSGTFERYDQSVAGIQMGSRSHRYTEYLVKVVKDFKRCIDYLETRPDLDSRRIAYYGMSWGGVLGAIIPAVEERLQASVLLAGGFFRPALPQADQVSYVARVKTPTLMLNGKYDSLFPVMTGIQPMFDLLGTPAAHKRLVLYDTDHIPPRNEFIKETLAWLDKYLGPVKSSSGSRGRSAAW